MRKCSNHLIPSPSCAYCYPPKSIPEPDLDTRRVTNFSPAQSLMTGLSPDAPTITTANGGKQSYTGLDFAQLDPGVMFEAAAVMYHGAAKYGLDNWKGITAPEHLNHAIMHLYGFLRGDTQDDHLVHAMVRCMMARVVDRDGVTPR